jgi:hypothetical protein
MRLLYRCKGLILLRLSTMDIIYCSAELGPMLARDRRYYQRGILRHTVQLNRPIAIHAFGGRGSPIRFIRYLSNN